MFSPVMHAHSSDSSLYALCSERTVSLTERSTVWRASRKTGVARFVFPAGFGGCSDDRIRRYRRPRWHTRRARRDRRSRRNRKRTHIERNSATTTRGGKGRVSLRRLTVRADLGGCALVRPQFARAASTASREERLWVGQRVSPPAVSVTLGGPASRRNGCGASRRSCTVGRGEERSPERRPRPPFPLPAVRRQLSW